MELPKLKKIPQEFFDLQDDFYRRGWLEMIAKITYTLFPDVYRIQDMSEDMGHVGELKLYDPRSWELIETFGEAEKRDILIASI